MSNGLYFGDHLEWLRNAQEFPDGSVDLVYLDPPFSSNADYNVLNSTERIDAPRQPNPFAMVAREASREKQTEML